MTLKSGPNFKENLTFWLKNDMRNLVNFNKSSRRSEHFALMGYFYRKYVMFGFKNNIRNLVIYHTSN